MNSSLPSPSKKLEAQIFCGLSQCDGARANAAPAGADSDRKISAAKVL